MAAKAKVVVDKAGMDGLFRRAHEHALALDNGKSLRSEIVIAFENPVDMMRMLTGERIRLLDSLRVNGESLITDLATKLGRDKRAVSRDVSAMREHGLVRTRYVTNAGHGKNLLVMPSAKRVELNAAI